jgi:hypothetical protein
MLERRLDAAHDGFQDLDPRMALVLGFDQRPRREYRAGAIDHVAYRDLVSFQCLRLRQSWA